jgi:UDP-N-acetyl-D-glucosamine dehydrogenase
VSTNNYAPAEQLRRRLQQKTATIGVVGLGYVGLPLAVEYADQGFRTVGIDLDKSRVQALNRGINYNDDLDDDRVQRLVVEDQLQATTQYDVAEDIDVFFVCVPTPVTEHKEPDTGHIEAATASIAEHLRPGQLVILKSTTYPTTTETLVQPILEESAAEKGLAVGQDVFLAFSPERIDPGNETYTLENTPVVVGGTTTTATDLAEQVTAQIVEEVHTVSSARVAEMEKLLENIYRSVNIALVNELAQLCDRIGGVSMWEVVEAASTKPFGFQPFYPGPGLGGHCIPVDPHYLSWLGREYDFETSFITLSARINEEMPHYVADAVVQSVANQPIRLSEASVLLLGVSFKPNVDDIRHSPAYTVVNLLRERGVQNIRYSDPHVDHFQGPAEDEPLPSVELTTETLRSHDVAVVLADHDAFDYEHIAKHASYIVDTRNAMAENVAGELSNVRTLGGGSFRTAMSTASLRNTASSSREQV